MAKVKSKYRLGQMVWYIANGFVTNRTISAVFVDKWGSVQYAMTQAEYEGGKHTFEDDSVQGEDNLFGSKDSLINSIREQEDASDE